MADLTLQFKDILLAYIWTRLNNCDVLKKATVFNVENPNCRYGMEIFLILASFAPCFASTFVPSNLPYLLHFLWIHLQSYRSSSYYIQHGGEKFPHLVWVVSGIMVGGLALLRWCFERKPHQPIHFLKAS